MTSHDADRAALLVAIRAGIDANRQNARKWDPLYGWFRTRFGIDPTSRPGVAGKLLTEDKQLTNRLMKELPQLEPRYVVLSLMPEVDLGQVRRFLGEASLPEIRAALILRETKPVELLIYERDDVTDGLARIVPELTPIDAVRAVSSTAEAAAVAAVPTHGDPSVAIIIDDRVRRMVRLAIASGTAVVLIGPPGTGKTRLLDEVITELKADPAAAGFAEEIADPVWATPEESWGARELIGGETVDEKARLRFRPGYLLRALEQNRWLVLDEANRADMDRIFGGMLTWLAGQPVELGRASTDLDSPVVKLGWADGPACETLRVSELEAATPEGDPIEFNAGTEWRLLATYNALDAQRVFRFGEALGRRFSRVPIPAATPHQFDQALAPLLEGLPERVGTCISRLYRAHADQNATRVGPALFLRMAKYVRKGLAINETEVEVPQDETAQPEAPAAEGAVVAASETPPEDATQAVTAVAGEETTETPEEGAAAATEAQGATITEDSPQTASEPLVDQLIAEAYLVNVGPWLAGLEQSELASLRARAATAGGALSNEQWRWLEELLSSFGYSLQ